MPRTSETRIIPFRPEQMFDLVADIRRYPEFLPWCKALRIRDERDDDLGARIVTADMIVRFRGFEEKFTSRARLDRPKLEVMTEFIDGPFEYLENRWGFGAAEGGACRIDFAIDFTFRSRILQKLASSMFERALLKLSNAFEARAHALYGPVLYGNAISKDAG